MDHVAREGGHIPRPPNAFILFRSQFIKNNHIPGNVEGNHSTLSKIIALCWKALPPDERHDWEEKARAAQAEHRLQYPDWRWKPEANTLAKKRPPRKRKRSAEQDDTDPHHPKPKTTNDDSRVAKIAELVKQGKTGVQLEHALGDWQRSASSKAPPSPPSPKKRRPRVQRRATKSSSATPPSPVPEPQQQQQPVESSTQHVFLCSPSNPAPTPDHSRALTLVWEETITPASYSPTTSDPPYWKSYAPLDSQDEMGYEQGLQFDPAYSQARLLPFFFSLLLNSSQPFNSQDEDRSTWLSNNLRHGFSSVVCDSTNTIPGSSTDYPSLEDTLYTDVSLCSENIAFVHSNFSALAGWAGEIDYPSTSADQQTGWQPHTWNP